MSTPVPDRPPRPGRRQFWRATLGTFLIAALIGTGLALFLHTTLKAAIAGIDHHVQRIAHVNDVLAGVTSGGPQTILILGSDHRAGPAIEKVGQGQWGNSDTMMLLRLNPNAPATTALSIPRDLKVTIPGQGVAKINAAYAAGGPRLAIQTLHDDLGIRVNHVIDIGFLGFERAVDALHCVYVDIDRRYFNDNNPPAGGDGPYAVINVPAGYQRMCGEDALSYVRFRHLDTDLVRAARQQTFLSQVKAQLPLETLLTQGGGLLDTLAKQTATDVHANQWLQVLRLAVDSIGHPLVQVKFPADTPPPAYPGAPSYVTVAPDNLKKALQAFYHPVTPAAQTTPAQHHTSKHTKKRSRSKHPAASASAVPDGLVTAGPIGDQLGAAFARQVHFPVYMPTYMTASGSYPTDGSRAYTILDRNRKPHEAYRLVVDSGLDGPGHYYGVQGLAWANPPILSGPYDTIEEGGRTFDLYYDGRRVQRVVWRQGHNVYWVSNTLQNELSYGQMIGIAKSLSRRR